MQSATRCALITWLVVPVLPVVRVSTWYAVSLSAVSTDVLLNDIAPEGSFTVQSAL